MKCSDPRGLLIKGNSQAEVGDPGAKCWPVPFPSHGARLGAALGAWGPPGPTPPPELSLGPSADKGISGLVSGGGLLLPPLLTM